MKTATTGEFKNLAYDLTAEIDDFRARLFQLGLIKDNEGRARAHRGGFFRSKKPPAIRPSSNEA